MRRGGIFALVTYIIYTLLYGGLTLALLHWIENYEGEDLGYGGIIIILVLGLCVALAIGGLVAVVLKLLHMVTGWVIFVIPCILIDAYSVLSIISSVFTDAYTVIITQGVSVETIIALAVGMIVPLFFSAGALISNIKSLKN